MYKRQAQPVAAGTAQSAAAPATPTPAPTPTPVPTLRPWSQPCVAEYDYQYEDATRYIHIDRVEENGTTYFVADVQLQSASQFGTWFAGDAYGGRDEPLSSMARKAGAVFAVNADNYNAHEYGVIIRDGVLYRTRETTRNMLIVDQNGDFTVRTDRADDDPEAVGAELVAQGVLHTFEFGPELVRDGVAVEFDPGFNVISTRDTRLEPRTAIGQIGPCLLYTSSLAARAAGRIGTAIQLTDTGIQPGSGVGNHRRSLTRETLGVPVIAVGMPTVIYAATLTRDAMETLSPDTAEDDLDRVEQELLTGAQGEMVVTPREIDEIISDTAGVIATAVNRALQPDLSQEEILSLIHI